MLLAQLNPRWSHAPGGRHPESPFAGIRTLRQTAGLCETYRFSRLGPIHPGRPPVPPRKPVQIGRRVRQGFPDCLKAG